jgi:hypothetical protein
MCPETIRWRAFECMKFAQNTGDPQHRALLLELARSWADLANAVEHYQEFAEAAEGSLIDGVDPKAKAREQRVTRARRKRARSSSVHRRRRRGQVSSKRGVGGR